MSFTFIDLFAGIGGFHAALHALGGKGVYASEIDAYAANIYERNWGLKPAGDITLAANEHVMTVPLHDVLTGGFPCQPFSKSGQQRGMAETRGTLFWNIARIIELQKPKIVLLENVRNLAGPRHAHEWEVIIQTLRELGYRVSSKPFVMSPHRIRPEHGGRPQTRDRVFIAATFSGDPVVAFSEPPALDLSEVTHNWDPKSWDLETHLPLQKVAELGPESMNLSTAEMLWIEAWNDFVVTMRSALGIKPLPGFPIWVDSWVPLKDLVISEATPAWKANFLLKNANFYTENMAVLDAWLARWDNLAEFPPSRRKFEWQAQDAEDIWAGILHFRPSGIRVKKATYVPALVAIAQTTILGKQKRRITAIEGARLQGLPENFDFMEQPQGITFKQLGNGVNVGVVYHVLRALVERDKELLSDSPKLVSSILNSSPNPSLNRAKK